MEKAGGFSGKHASIRRNAFEVAWKKLNDEAKYYSFLRRLETLNEEAL